MLSNDDLESLSELNVESIKKGVLKELTEITIDTNLNIENRMEKFLNTIHNPYYFLVDGTPVQITYNNHNNKTLDDCLYSYLNERQNKDN